MAEQHSHKPGRSILQFSIELMGMKKTMEKSILNNSFSKEAATLPASMCKRFEISTQTVKARTVWSIAPKDNPEATLVIFLHGGAYYSNMTRMHWRLVEQLVISTGLRFIVPDYPLAPEATCSEVYAFMDQVYAQVTRDYPDSKIILMGDSAGGGLALGFAQYLHRDAGSKRQILDAPLSGGSSDVGQQFSSKQPQRIILLSSWLDISLTHPDIPELDKRDKILSVKGLKVAGVAYAGELELTDYRVSPINGPLDLKGKIAIFTGTNDLLLADARNLKYLLESRKMDFDYFEFPEMFHDWILIPQLKETKQAIVMIKDLLEQ